MRSIGWAACCCFLYTGGSVTCDNHIFIFNVACINISQGRTAVRPCSTNWNKRCGQYTFNKLGRTIIVYTLLTNRTTEIPFDSKERGLA